MDKCFKDRGKEWGRAHRLKEQAGFYRIGPMGRIQIEGFGAGLQGGQRDYVPIRDWPDNWPYWDMERAYKKCSPIQKLCMRLYFWYKASPNQKAQVACVSRARFYEIVAECELIWREVS